MKQRKLVNVIKAKPASDGAGVKLNRLIGAGGLQGFDPFLMLDEFNSDNADDYIAGFPAHPHRGFETVTYMLEGNMLHQDHLGNQGLLQSGDVQWMTAARGIIHSEMPQQVEGRMRGFQLWINLPASEKMNDPHYKDIKSTDIPVIDTDDYWIKVIAGAISLNGQTIQGAVQGIATAPLYLDVRLQPDQPLTLPVPESHKLLIYVYDGSLTVAQDRALTAQHMGVTDSGTELTLNAGEKGANALILAGKPLNEPIANWGPFVMNTQEEVEQAINDYRDGTLTH